MELTPQIVLPRRALLNGALVLGAAAALSGCGGTAPASTSPRAVVLTDQRGKRLTFDHPVRRIVTLPMPAAAMVIAVDQSAQHLVGMIDASWTAVRDGTLGSMFPAALKIPHDVATEDFVPNVESILALKPDVVVQWASQGDAIIAPLTNAGLPVLGVDYGTLADVDTWLTMFATMLGKPERGKAMVSRIDIAKKSMIAEAATRTGPRPKVLYFLRFADGFQVAGGETFNGDYITLVGAENAAAEVKGGFGAVGIEQVLRWDPDIVLLGNFDEAMPDDVYSSSVWKDVSAVRTRRVYRVPLGGYRWDPPSHETPLMWRWLADIAFPSGSPSALRTQIGDDYAFFYGARPSSAEVDTMLWIDANKNSASYGQFSAA